VNRVKFFFFVIITMAICCNRLICLLLSGYRFEQQIQVGSCGSMAIRGISASSWFRLFSIRCALRRHKSPNDHLLQHTRDKPPALSFSQGCHDPYKYSDLAL